MKKKPALEVEMTDNEARSLLEKIVNLKGPEWVRSQTDVLDVTDIYRP